MQKLLLDYVVNIKCIESLFGLLNLLECRLTLEIKLLRIVLVNHVLHEAVSQNHGFSIPIELKEGFVMNYCILG